jgi:hypothetical protein
LWLNSERQAAIDRERQQTAAAKAAVEREDLERKAHQPTSAQEAQAGKDRWRGSKS